MSNNLPWHPLYFKTSKKSFHCAGNKGGNEKRFYKQMIPIADFEFAKHLEELEK